MNKIDILVVEDEAIVALETQRTLIKMGFIVVAIATNYDEALACVEKKRPDIILLDVNLKESRDGIEIAKAMKSIADIAIVYLTAFTDEKTIQRAIQTNPIAYLIKPFKREELNATLKLAVYKMGVTESTKNDLYNLGHGYRYDQNNHNLFFHEHPLKLSSKEKFLLELLLEAKGKIVPFALLEEEIWEGNFVSSSALRTLVYRLRGKLEYKLIETVPSFGLKITCS